MKNKTLERIVDKIIEYELVNEFDSPEQFKKWISFLSERQIENFLNLDINVMYFDSYKEILIDFSLLSCNNYDEIINLLMKVKDSNVKLFELLYNHRRIFLSQYKKICESINLLMNEGENMLDFLNAYSDNALEKLLKSRYFADDLKLISKFVNESTFEKKVDDVLPAREVAFTLTSVAVSDFSMQSPYHLNDMNLISKIGGEYIQNGNLGDDFKRLFYLLFRLAVNRDSLSDQYHFENMKILATNPIAKDFLFLIMTNPEIIAGKNYRDEVMALVKAKSIHTARGMYYYIVNPSTKFENDHSFYDDKDYEIEDRCFVFIKYVSGKKDDEYIANLTAINEVKDQCILHYVSILMNPKFIDSPYKKFDLSLLNGISDKDIFMDLYFLIENEFFLRSKYHKEDAILISKTKDFRIRKLLLKRAAMEITEDDRHIYDMNYISNLDLDSIDEKILSAMKYYLFDPDGISDSNHLECLQKLAQGIMVNPLYNYFCALKSQIATSMDIDSSEVIRGGLSFRGILKRVRNYRKG